MTDEPCGNSSCDCCYSQHCCNFDGSEDFPVCKNCGQEWEKRPITDAAEIVQKAAINGPGYFFRPIKQET